MKKTHISIILTISLVSLLASCAHPLMKDPRLYNQGDKAESKPQIPTEEPEIEKPQGFTPFDLLNEWYNNPDTNGDENNKEAVGFSNTEFNEMSISGWFSKQNVPTYTMKKQNVWGSCADSVRNEYVHSGAPNTEGQGFTINGVTYFQYRGKNPCYAGDGSYNTIYQTTANGNPLLERFYFYRFTGKGGGIQWLDNFLIAIDTYSKLVFAFSEPVAFSSMGAPTAWAATDKDKYHGAVYPFYMYDPVGYVLKKDDGSYTVELYKWFKDRLAAGNYKGNINPGYTTIAGKTPNGAGRSPFLSEVQPAAVPFLEKVKGRTFAARENYKGLNANWKEDGQGYGENLIEFVFSEDGKTLTMKSTPWNGKATTVTATTDIDMSVIDKAEYKDSDNKTYNIAIDKEGKVLTINDVKFFIGFQDKGPAFKIMAAGKTFTGRTHNANGDDLDLYKFVFDNECSIADLTLTSWGKAPVEGKNLPVKYVEGDYSKVQITDKGKNIVLSLNEKADTLYTNMNLTAYTNFTDPTPTFKNRVKNRPAFESEDKNHSYFFKEGFSTLVVDNKTTYGFDCVQSGRNRAIYSRKEGISWYLIGIELCDDGKTIKRTDEKLKIFTSEVDWTTLGTPAELVDKISDKDFTTIVANQTFGFRELEGYAGTDGEGYGLNLYTYKFSPDGNKLTFTTTPWRKDPVVVESDVVINPNNKIKATVNINNKKVDLSINDSATILTIGEELAYLNFKDLGPSFENRVKDNPEFKGGNNYKFTNGYKTLKIDGKDYTFERIEPERNKAVYWKKDWFGVYYFYGVELSNNDNTIKSTNGSGKNAIQWNTLGYAATRN